MHKIIKFLGPNAERSHDPSTVHSFHAIRYAPFIDEIDNTVAKHFTVNTEILVGLKESQYGVGNTPDSQLQGGAIGYQILGNIFADFVFILGGCLYRVCWQWLVKFRCEIQVTLVDKSVAESSRQVFVHLG